jgi:hypothetical protein
MKHIYVPYSGEAPASLLINGHRVLIVSPEPEQLQAHLEDFGGDHLQEMNCEETDNAATELLESLAKKIEGGVVVAPGDIRLEQILHELEAGLPWVH